MNIKTLVKFAAPALCLLGLSAAQVADSTDSNGIYAGAYLVQFHSTASDLSGPYTIPGLNAGLDNVTTAYFAYIRRLSEHVDVELAAGDPPTTKTIGQGPATVGSVPFNGQTLITAKWLSPTALLEYKFMSDSDALRPYVGVGINHTVFYDRQVTLAGQHVTGGPTSLSLTPSTGLAATLGLSYRVDSHWYAHASYSVSNIHTTASSDTAGLIRKTHIDFGPRAVVLAVGYTF
jgi:outer membrane protein